MCVCVLCVQCEFADMAPVFKECQVDGDLLLLLTEDHLRDDLGMTNGILRKRWEQSGVSLSQLCMLYYMCVKGKGRMYCIW